MYVCARQISIHPSPKRTRCLCLRVDLHAQRLWVWVDVWCGWRRGMSVRSSTSMTIHSTNQPHRTYPAHGPSHRSRRRRQRRAQGAARWPRHAETPGVGRPGEQEQHGGRCNHNQLEARSSSPAAGARWQGRRRRRRRGGAAAGAGSVDGGFPRRGRLHPYVCVVVAAAGVSIFRDAVTHAHVQPRCCCCCWWLLGKGGCPPPRSIDRPNRHPCQPNPHRQQPPPTLNPSSGTWVELPRHHHSEPLARAVAWKRRAAAAGSRRKGLASWGSLGAQATQPPPGARQSDTTEVCEHGRF